MKTMLASLQFTRDQRQSEPYLTGAFLPDIRVRGWCVVCCVPAFWENTVLLLIEKYNINYQIILVYWFSSTGYTRSTHHSVTITCRIIEFSRQSLETIISHCYWVVGRSVDPTIRKMDEFAPRPGYLICLNTLWSEESERRGDIVKGVSSFCKSFISVHESGYRFQECANDLSLWSLKIKTKPCVILWKLSVSFLP